MQNFARNLADNLSARDIPLPELMISASEYGQYSYSDPENPFGSVFNEMLVKSPNLSSVIEHKHEVKLSDPSILVPRADNPKRLMQVSGIVLPSESEIG